MSNVWNPISTAPVDDREFYVGRWKGEGIYDPEDNYNQTGWVNEPVWEQAVSHHENPSGPHTTRGWNHRNGPLSGYATHWAELLPAPEQPLRVLSRKD